MTGITVGSVHHGMESLSLSIIVVSVSVIYSVRMMFQKTGNSR